MKQIDQVSSTFSTHASWVGPTILLWACAIFLVGCSKPIANSPFAVVDTGIWANGVETLIWLDNHRILFNSTETLTPSPRSQTVVWDTDTKTLARLPLIQEVICGRGGNIFYVIKDETSKNLTFYRGPLENIVEHPSPGADMRVDEVFDCDWVPAASHGQFGFGSYPAKSKLVGTNYINIIEPRTKLTEYEKRLPHSKNRVVENGSGSMGKRIFYANANDPGREVPALGLEYSEFLDSYISSGYYDPTDPEGRSFWILHRDGNMQEIFYPKTMLTGRNKVFPVKGGYLVDYGDGRITETDSGAQGLYFISATGTFQRLLIGEMAQKINGISPNGCMAAFSHANTIKENLSTTTPYRTIKYINFCHKGISP